MPLWSLWDNNVEEFCKAWRQGQRAVWKLPFNTHRRYLPLLCDSIPVVDEICRRFLSFITNCLNSECRLVQFVVKYGLLFGHMQSLCGRNALFCANRYLFSITDMFVPHFSVNIIKQRCAETTTTDDVAVVSFLLELLFLRDNTFYLSDSNFFTKNDFTSMIAYMCSL
mgnify:FL=1